MHSQNREEEIIAEFVGAEVGRFLDLGAYDGKTNSNTLALAEKGWGGVLVEPSPVMFQKLFELHSENDNLTLVNCAVGAEPGLVEFWDLPDGYATARANLGKGRPFKIWRITMEQLLNSIGGNFAVISIDAEGESFDLFQSLPLESIKPKVICVEHDNRLLELSARAEEHGYHAYHMNQENVIFARK